MSRSRPLQGSKRHYGHLVGDGLLRAAARHLQAAAEGAFLARIGGDEFIVVLSCAEPEVTAGLIGERMIEAFKDNFEVNGHQIQVGLSVGVAVYPADGTDATALIANADAALYQAKSEVRGSVKARLASARMARAADRPVERARPWRPTPALPAAEDHRLRQGYRLRGTRTLALPERGWVSPETFVPIAEQSTQIVAPREWILREACKEAASWPNPLRVAVNISPVQFHHGDLAKLVHLSCWRQA